MYQSIAEANDLSPRDFRVALSAGFRDTIRRLTNNLSKSDECKAQHPVRTQIGTEAILNESYGFARMIKHVLQTHGIVMP